MSLGRPGNMPASPRRTEKHRTLSSCRDAIDGGGGAGFVCSTGADSMPVLPMGVFAAFLLSAMLNMSPARKQPSSMETCGEKRAR